MNDKNRPLFNSDCSKRVRELENALLLVAADEGLTPAVRSALRYRFEHCRQSNCYSCNLIFGPIDIDQVAAGASNAARAERSRAASKRSATLLISKGLSMYLANPGNT